VDAIWAATDPDSLRLSFTERRISADEYIAHIGALLNAGADYSEVNRAGLQYPRLALSFRAAVGWFTSSPPRTRCSS
jgi:hypothetical protein